MHGETPLARIEIRHDGARLQRHARMAPEVELCLQHLARRKGAIHVARIELALEGQIVAKLGMDDRRRGVQRGAHVGDDGQLLVVHAQMLQRILSLRPCARHHSHHSLALPAGAIHRHGVLRG